MSHAFQETLSAVVATTALPVALLRATYDRNFRESVPERLGYGGWRTLRTNLSRTDPGEELIWLHGASVGEVQGVVPVAERIAREIPNLTRLVSTTSLTGRSEVERRKIAKHAFLFPYDHPLVVRRILRSARVKAFVMFETEIWPNLLFSLRHHNVPALVVNGRISDGSFPIYLKMKRFFSSALSAVAQFQVQTELDRERYLALGVDPGRVSVSGSTKYDQGEGIPTDAELIEFGAELGITREKPCLVAGSVRPGEDEELIAAFAAARVVCPELQLIVAPRHPNNFEICAGHLRNARLQFARRSLLESASGSGIMLLDTLGELRRAYGLADIAFVGGTLVDVGGHNPLEPAMYGAPVIVGPFVQNVRDAMRELVVAGGGFIGSGAAEVREILGRFINNRDLCVRSGAAAKRVWTENLGATERALGLIKPYL